MITSSSQWITGLVYRLKCEQSNEDLQFFNWSSISHICIYLRIYCLSLIHNDRGKVNYAVIHCTTLKIDRKCVNMIYTHPKPFVLHRTKLYITIMQITMHRCGPKLMGNLELSEHRNLADAFFNCHRLTKWYRINLMFWCSSCTEPDRRKRRRTVDIYGAFFLAQVVISECQLQA